MSELDDVIDALYAVPPTEFVARRTAAVKAARADKHRDLATAISELRRPTVSAWLVNLLVRSDAEVAGQLVALGDELREAERSLHGPGLRELSKQRRQLVRALVVRARSLAQPTGQKIGDGVLQELEATLTAALADPAVAREVVSGRLTVSRAYAGFGSADSAAEGVPPASPPKPTTTRPARGRLRLVRDPEPPAPAVEVGSPAAVRDRRRRREAQEQRARDQAQADWEQAERAAVQARQRYDAAAASREEGAAEVARTESAAARAQEDRDGLARALAQARRRLASASEAATVADADAALAQETLRADEHELAAAEGDLRRAERAREAAAAARDATVPPQG